MIDRLFFFNYKYYILVINKFTMNQEKHLFIKWDSQRFGGFGIGRQRLRAQFSAWFEKSSALTDFQLILIKNFKGSWCRNEIYKMIINPILIVAYGVIEIGQTRLHRWMNLARKP